MNPFENPHEDSDLQGIWQALDDLPPVPAVSANLEARVWAQLAQTETPVTPLWLQRLSLAFEWLHVPAFAGLLLGLGLFLGQGQLASSSVALKRPVPHGASDLKHSFPVQTEDVLRWVMTFKS